MRIKKASRAGFTLIELLTVIAIIGILAAILIPAVGKVREVANKMKSSANIRSIAVSYATYSTSGGKVKVLTSTKLTNAGYTDSVQGVAEFLADKVDLTDASIWLIGTDPLVTDYENEGKTIPEVIGYRDADNAFQTSPDWSSDAPVGYDFALAAGGNDPASTTPLTWTRGLSEGAVGVWGKTTPWGRGGHIAFLDGHVSFYNDLKGDDGQLVDPSNGLLTDDITKIHDSANIKLAPTASN